MRMRCSKMAGSVGLLVSALAAVIAGTSCVVAARDWTVVENARGTDVVHAVLTKLGSCEANNLTDHRLLRRIAFVETGDGRKLREGGVWGLQKSKFDSVNQTMMREWLTHSCRHLLNNDDSLIGRVLVDLYASTSIPMVSGLAATLYLHYLTQSRGVVIPLAADVSGQANISHDYYNRSTSTSYFVERVELLEEMESCRVNADIVFVLDISHSIEDDDLRKVVVFETEFVQRLTIGPDNDRVGTVLFGRHAHNVYNLTSYQDKTEVLAAVGGIYNFTQDIWKKQRTQSTNIAAGLCNTWEMFRSDIRPSATVFRMAVVMSDGTTQDYPNNVDCGWSFDEAVEQVHALRPPLLVYVVGVSNAVSDAELRKIATDGDHYIHLDDFNLDSLHGVDETVTDDLCWKATIDITDDIHKFIDGSLDRNKVVRYNLSVPVIGITVQVCVSRGKVGVYGSVSYPAPNSALNDFQLQLDCKPSASGGENCLCRNAFVPGSATVGSYSSRQHYDRTVKREAIATVVYITIEGRNSQSNEFLMNATDGDAATDCVGVMVADDCGEKSTTPSPPDHSSSTSPSSSPSTPPSASESSSEKTIIIIAAFSSAAFGSVLVCCILVWSVVGGRAVYRRRKQQNLQRDDEYHLLEDDGVEI